MKFLISLFLLLVVSNSCDTSKKAIENSKGMQEQLSGTYNITQIGDRDVSALQLEITFDEATNNITGFAGCNRFFGNYTIENNTITFGSIGSSKKLCAGDASNTENQFLKSLNSLNTFSTNDNSITFSENDTSLVKGIKKVVVSSKSIYNNVAYKNSVKYKSLSRSSFDYIIISKSGIIISKDNSLQNIDKYTTEAKDWKAINELIEAIDVETMKDLTPPSVKHQYDGAPHATLSIIIGDIEYTTPTFDHGNPPQSIEALVNKVLSVKEKTEKQ